MTITLAFELNNKIMDTYNESYRTYHNIQHINYLLAKSLIAFQNKNITLTLDQQSSVSLAIMMHDLVYNIWYPVGWNEHFSELRFREFISQGFITNISDEQIEDISHAILATAHHTEQQALDDHPVTQWMLDLDLLGFSEPYEAVIYNSNNVLKEVEALGIPKKTLLNNRVKFLTKLLDRDKLYYTKQFEDMIPIAIDNIKQQIIDTQIELESLK